MKDKYYIKDVCEIGKVEFIDVVNTLKQVSPDFKPKGGLNAELDFNLFRAVCQKYSIDVNEDGGITIYKNTDGGKVNFAPTNVIHKAKPLMTYNEVSLEEYNTLKCDKIDPVKIRTEMSQLPTDVNLAFKVVDAMPGEKTILNDSLVHDFNYLKALFNPYNFAIVPVNLGRRIRDQIDPFFTKMYVTDKFNNKIIAFNKEKSLYAFIINV